MESLSKQQQSLSYPLNIFDGQYVIDIVRSYEELDLALDLVDYSFVNFELSIITSKTTLEEHRVLTNNFRRAFFEDQISIILWKINADKSRTIAGTILAHDLFGNNFEDLPYYKQPESLKAVSYVLEDAFHSSLEKKMIDQMQQRYAHLYFTAVHHDFMGKGFCFTLLNAFKKLVKMKNYQYIYIECTSPYTYKASRKSFCDMDEQILYKIDIKNYEYNGFKPFINSGIPGDDQDLKVCLYEFKSQFIPCL